MSVTEARHDDLDISQEEDRAIDRQRVDREFEHMKLEASREAAGDLTRKRVAPSRRGTPPSAR